MYRDTIISNISLDTTAAESPSFTNILFVTANAYFEDRLMAFSDIDVVKAMLPTDSNAYKGLRLALSQRNGAPQPIYLGRRKVDEVVLEPSTDRLGKITQYSLTVKSTEKDLTVTHTSTTSETAENIVEALKNKIDNSDLTVAAADGKLTISESSSKKLVVCDVKNMTESFTTSETAADLLAAIMEENDSDWYVMSCEDHTETFVMAMAAEIEATGSSNTPKIYAVSSADAETITPLVDPADDLFGKLQELGYIRTYPFWSHNADSVFAELAPIATNAIYQPGVTTYKFMQLSGVGNAADPVTGKDLRSARLGYIADRNASWQSRERGVDFAHGGKVAGGEWLDVIIARDWMNDRIESRLLTLLLNQVGGKIPFTPEGKQKVANVIDGVLQESVNLGILSGYIPTTIPEITAFEDQAHRILDQVKFTGFLAGAIHFINVSGKLTYKDDLIN